MFRRVSTQYENVADIRTEGYRDSVARQKNYSGAFSLLLYNAR